jgi:hypothetical protein
VKVRSRRPALLDAHDVDFGGSYRLEFNNTAVAIAIE